MPDGTDASFFNPRADGRAVRTKYGLTAPIFLFHGDVKYSDGLDVLFRAFARLIAVEPRARLVIMGGGGESPGVVRMAEEAGIRSAVVFTGWVPREDVPRIIAASDAGVMPLRNTLNNNVYFSFKLFEYWGVAKPVIVSRMRTISTVVKNRVNGILVPPENEEELKKAMLFIARNPAQAREMGRRGRAAVKKDFDWKKLMDREVAECEDAILGGGSSAS